MNYEFRLPERLIAKLSRKYFRDTLPYPLFKNRKLLKMRKFTDILTGINLVE